MLAHSKRPYFESHDWLCMNGIYGPRIIFVGPYIMFDLEPWDKNIPGFYDMFDVPNVVSLTSVRSAKQWRKAA